MSDDKNERTHRSGRSSGKYFKIEVRTTYRQPTVLPAEGREPFVIDGQWREWPVYLGATKFGANIPVKNWNSHAGEHGLFSYEVAESHRWALIALLDAHHSSLCIQTRLVAVEFTEEYSTREIGVSEPMELQRRPWDAFTPRVPSENLEGGKR